MVNVAPARAGPLISSPPSASNNPSGAAWPEAHYLAGLGHLGLGESAEARTAFTKALETSPDHLGAARALAGNDAARGRILSGNARPTLRAHMAYVPQPTTALVRVVYLITSAGLLIWGLTLLRPCCAAGSLSATGSRAFLGALLALVTAWLDLRAIRRQAPRRTPRTPHPGPDPDLERTRATPRHASAPRRQTAPNPRPMPEFFDTTPTSITPISPAISTPSSNAPPPRRSPGSSASAPTRTAAGGPWPSPTAIPNLRRGGLAPFRRHEGPAGRPSAAPGAGRASEGRGPR